MKLRILAACLTSLMASSAFAASDGVAVAAVMAVNDHEIKAAALAIEKGVSEPVAAYANMMTTEHGANQSKLEKLIQTAAVLPEQSADVKAMKDKTMAAREAMAALDGDVFEAAYVDAMVKDHAEVLAKLDAELIPGATNPAVISHLKETRGHVEMHLEQAKKLDANPTASR